MDMRELILLRHGKAVAKRDGDDLMRPIKDRGKRAAQRVGVWMARQDLIPDHVVASPAERAATTAAKCLKAMGQSAGGVVLDQRIYEATSEKDLLAALADCPGEARRVLLVGHNPGLRHLLAFLSGSSADDSDKAPRLPTAGLARLAMPDDWSLLQPGQATLQAMQLPDQLPNGFPFPSPHGEELRDRPAYYYTQSSVIPYRLENGRLEILIVRSSQNKHWVVPKGIAEPGYSLQSSAAKEAREEAGVEGVVDEEALGDYESPKWGASCTVTVYPMRVWQVLRDQDWEERHRGRKWVSPQVARLLLREPALGPIVNMLERRLGAS